MQNEPSEGCCCQLPCARVYGLEVWVLGIEGCSQNVGPLFGIMAHKIYGCQNGTLVLGTTHAKRPDKG